MHVRILLAGLLATSACTGAAKPINASVRTASPEAAATPRTTNKTLRDADKPDARRLPTHATFGELVHLASVLDDGGQGHSETGCLLSGHEAPRFAADLAPAARPLPAPPEHVADDLLEQIGSVSVMSTWGSLTGELRSVILLAFTTTSTKAIKEPALGLFVTRNGVFVRGAASQLRARPSAMSAEDAGALLSQLPEAGTIYATADRAVEVQTLLNALRFIPNRFEVALAVALPQNTRLPAGPVDTKEGLCAAGLSPPHADEPEGELTVAAAQSAVAPLRQAALDCAQQAGGRALLGGRLTLALRIGADGRAREACFPQDDIHEPVLRRCLISHSRDLHLPQPSPKGFADLQLPLQLDLTGPTAQRASCD